MPPPHHPPPSGTEHGHDGAAARERVYVTTPIYYVNDRPHIGHAYTTTVCDVYARAMRSLGHEVFFLTGTDEHGVKVEKSAREHGLEPQEWADRNAATFQQILATFELTNDDFIRTTQARHVVQVQAFVAELIRRGVVYLGRFEGWYDEGQEEYYTQTKAESVGLVSPVNGRPLVRASEENYFFRLSAFQSRLEALFAERPEFVRPAARRNEVLGRLREGLQDFPISRTNFSWGIPVPGDERHVLWVWVDALFNYASALGMGAGLGFRDGADAGSGTPQGPRPSVPESLHVDPARRRFWPATYHVVGKEILWFHAVVWPAILMALELPLPQTIYAHSFWISGGQKMSKSLGNFVDIETIETFLDRYGLDSWRWFMATRGPIGASDSDFTAAAFHESYTTDLVNTVGNCASRVTAMIERYFGGVVPPDDPGLAIGAAAGLDDLAGESRRVVEAAIEAFGRFELADALLGAVGLLRSVDAFINASEPFRIAKDEGRRAELGAILYRCAEAVRIAGALLEPAMPGRMATLAAALGGGEPRGSLVERTRWGGLRPGDRVSKLALFPRLEPKA
ncbi:MAG TPA: methionine--tRNA ligase [Phycisphaerales bacterium]|nr:methionine--tRNA ligase [Phycisphaerales bacterium]HMP37530.1 methionine--tRNA ligase [Phycisphaerales bacterium]